MADISHIIQLIQNNPSLTDEEKKARIQWFTERVGARGGPSYESLLEDSRRAVRTAEDLVEFCHSRPGIRRWYVARVYAEIPRARTHQDQPEPFEWLDLYYSEASNELKARLPEEMPLVIAEEFFARQSRDYLHWWEDEDFDQGVHLPKTEFREFLNEFSSYPADQPILEGMVFIEMTSEERQIRVLQFTPQARNMSKEVFRELIGPEGTPE